MLALRPNPPPPDLLQCRGRSRHISASAIARQASEERKGAVSSVPTHAQTSTLHINRPIIPIVAPVPMKLACPPPFMRSASSSPPSSASMSPDCYDSPPSPPLSLEDQVHVAYALDDIHRAKILLLRLKGIEVDSDDDPRIAEVQDEDFDFCFVPNGRLMDDRDEKAMMEMQAKEMERLQERRRAEKLRECERRWQAEKRRMREERLAVLRRKRQEEEDHRRKAEELSRRQAALEDERHRITREKAAAAELHRVAMKGRARQVVNYDSLRQLASTANHSDQQFVYDCMPASPRPQPRRLLSPSPPVSHSRAPFPAPTFDDSYSVPFTDVLKSMQGPLFPLLVDERTRRADTPVCSKSRSRNPKRRRESELLDALLVHLESSDEERRRSKGKQKPQTRRSPLCQACSTPSPTCPLSPSPTLGSINRTSSWLSFRGSPSPTSSASTDITTPSSSPRSSWFIHPKSWIIADSNSSPPSSLRHSCHPRLQLTAVLPSDSPLVLEVQQPPKPIPISYQGGQRSTSKVRATKDGAGVLVRRVSRFVEIAKGFQTAYANVALLSASVSFDAFEAREMNSDGSDWTWGPRQDRSRALISSSPTLRPAGYRASKADVANFLAGPSGDKEDSPDQSYMPPPKYIPLTSPFPPTEPPCTILPDPLPYQLHFKPIPPPIRSPFRFHSLSELHTMYPCPTPTLSTRLGGNITFRIRSVGNPAYLRLKALHNIVWKRGMAWEGASRETAQGSGRERVLGYAYEGVGSSLLSRG